MSDPFVDREESDMEQTGATGGSVHPSSLHRPKVDRQRRTRADETASEQSGDESAALPRSTGGTLIKDPSVLIPLPRDDEANEPSFAKSAPKKGKKYNKRRGKKLTSSRDTADCASVGTDGASALGASATRASARSANAPSGIKQVLTTRVVCLHHLVVLYPG